MSAPVFHFFQGGDTPRWTVSTFESKKVDWDKAAGPGWTVERIFVHDELIFQRAPSKETVEEKRWNDPAYRAAYCGLPISGNP
jgi:hypothetical protein